LVEFVEQSIEPTGPGSGGAWTLQMVLRPKFNEKLTFNCCATHAMDNFSISYCKRNTRNTIGAAAGAWVFMGLANLKWSDLFDNSIDHL
jgi:hypothetical protein